MRATWRPLPAWPYESRAKQPDRFKATWTASLNKLESEIGLVEGREVIIGVVTDEANVRLDGQLRAGAKYAHSGVEVSFELPDGRRATFHTDAFPWVASNLRAIALGLEALRTVDRYGITSSGEQYAGFLQLAAGGPDAERGRVLVERAGSMTEALKRHHPDHGGEARDFVDVQAFKKAQAVAAR